MLIASLAVPVERQKGAGLVAGFEISEELVRHLIREQFPDWSDRVIRRVTSAGTDNAIYRLGEDACVRLPRRASAGLYLEKEVRCLDGVNGLSLRTPKVLGVGTQTDIYPGPWAVYDWIEGSDVSPDQFEDCKQAAHALAAFLRELHAVQADDRPGPGRHNNYRGCPLTDRDSPTREAITGLLDLFDPTRLTEVWEMACSAAPWSGDPVLIHGDIHTGNLLQTGGQLSAVLDFGLSGWGDPAVDCIVAWSFFSERARDHFRSALGCDDATWQRGRGWALSVSVIALDYHRDRNLFLANLSERAIRAVIA